MFKLLTTLNYFFVISIMSQDPGKVKCIMRYLIMMKRKKNTNLKIACACKISFKFSIGGPKAMMKLTLKHV